MRIERPTVFLATALIHHSVRTSAALVFHQNYTLNPLQSLQQLPLSSYSTLLEPNMTRLAPVISLSHGGGPMPILGDPSHKALTHSMRTRVPQILKLGTPEQPRAIVVVTAHWTTEKPTISSAAKHSLYYDYNGFPPESYSLKYDAPGSPEVAEMVRRAFEEVGVASRKDEQRGM